MQHPVMSTKMKDKRKPDELVSFYQAKAVAIPRQIDHSQFNPRYFNQDGQPMCVGVADAEAIANDAARKGMIPAGLPLYFSPIWNWNWGRFMRGTLNDKEGTYPEDVAQAICEYGVMPYTKWPCKRDDFGNIAFDPTDPNTRSTDAIMLPNMRKARINNGVQGLLAALADGVVSIAVPWFDEWNDYISGILAPIANATISARHNFVFDGFDQDAGLFFGPNSWEEWGIKESALGERPTTCGFKMPFEYIELFKQKFDGYDAWNFDFEYLNLPAMIFNLMLSTVPGGGGYGAGMYPAGSRVEIYAGKKAGFDFSMWKPTLNLDNPFSMTTKITMLDDAEITAYFKEQQKQAKRCRLFDIAKALNKKEGLS